MSDAPREVMHWGELGDAARALATQVHDDGFAPDLVLGIARGGLLVAGALGYALGVKNTFTMNVEFYTGIDERLPVPMILPPVPDLVDLHDARMLIADDVADTGHTLRSVQQFARDDRIVDFVVDWPRMREQRPSPRDGERDEAGGDQPVARRSRTIDGVGSRHQRRSPST